MDGTCPLLLLVLLGGADLEEAKKKLLDGEEGVVRQGAQICLEANSPEGVTLLLKTLGGSQPHMRDISFEYLEKFTNPYAIAVVEKELVSNKDEGMRAWCADLLGAYAGRGRLDPLHRALSDGAVRVRTSAARALGRLGLKESAAKLAPLKSHADPSLHAAALIAWARCDPKKNAPALIAALGDRDAGVRTALLAAAAEVVPEQALERATAALADADWRVRLQAVEILDRIGTKEAIPALIDRVGEPRPRVSNTAEKSLRWITGKEIAGKKAWQGWWEASGGSFEPPSASAPASGPASAPAAAKTVVTYYGLPVESDHVAFLIDRGATMANSSATGKGSKMDEVTAELEKTLRALPDTTRFNVYSYAGEVTAWGKKSETVGPKSIAAALAFLRSQSLAGRKNIWEAILAPLEDPDIDTFYLMSDGEPQDGEYVHWNRVVDHFQRRNAFRKVVVHTVSISDPKWSDSTKEWYRSQLRESERESARRARRPSVSSRPRLSRGKPFPTPFPAPAGCRRRAPRASSRSARSRGRCGRRAG
jgi:HEAT repeat protein